MIALPSMVALVLSTAPPTDTTAGAPSFESLNARQAVHEGNRRLTQGKPADALAAYQHAEKLKPDARRIAFAEGLAQFDLHHFDKAREAFRRAAVGKTDRLGLDAMYGLGATDHAEALAHADDPATAVGLLESAMRQYHGVLDEQPDHALARSANYKAARLWQQIKQQQKQQQQQQQNSDQDNKDKDKDKKQGEQQENKESPKDEQKKDQPSPQESEDQQQPPDEQQASPSQADQDEKNEQHKAAQEEKRVPQEQAQRQLREMMQALRERNKARRQTTHKVPIGAVDKDW